MDKNEERLIKAYRGLKKDIKEVVLKLILCIYEQEFNREDEDDRK